MAGSRLSDARSRLRVRLVLLVAGLLFAGGPRPTGAVAGCLVGDDQIKARLLEYSIVGVATIEKVTCVPGRRTEQRQADGTILRDMPRSELTLRFRELWRGWVDGPIVTDTDLSCPGSGLTCDDTRRSVAEGESVLVFGLPGEGARLGLAGFRFTEEMSTTEVAFWQDVVRRSDVFGWWSTRLAPGPAGDRGRGAAPGAERVSAGAIGALLCGAVRHCVPDCPSARCPLAIALTEPAVYGFVAEHATCDRCEFDDFIPGSGIGKCVEYRVLTGSTAFAVEFWVADRCNSQKPSEARLFVEGDFVRGVVDRVDPPPEFIRDPDYCVTDDDCLCLAGSGLFYTGCANRLHAPLLGHGGAFACGMCSCKDHRCEDVGDHQNPSSVESKVSSVPDSKKRTPSLRFARVPLY